MATASNPKSEVKINKSAWIRSQPASMSAADVAKKAKDSGIKLTVAQVYTARSNANKKKGLSKGKPGRPKGSTNKKPAAVSSSSGGSDEMAFRRLVLSIGLPKADAYLADLKRSVGL